MSISRIILLLYILRMKLLLTCLLLMVAVVTLVAADEAQEMKGLEYKYSYFRKLYIYTFTLSFYNRNIIINDGSEINLYTIHNDI